MANRHFRGGGALKAEAVAEMIHGKSMKRCAVTRAVCEASALWHANPWPHTKKWASTQPQLLWRGAQCDATSSTCPPLRLPSFLGWRSSSDLSTRSWWMNGGWCKNSVTEFYLRRCLKVVIEFSPCQVRKKNEKERNNATHERISFINVQIRVFVQRENSPNNSKGVFTWYLTCL